VTKKTSLNARFSFVILAFTPNSHHQKREDTLAKQIILMKNARKNWQRKEERRKKQRKLENSKILQRKREPSPQEDD